MPVVKTEKNKKSETVVGVVVPTQESKPKVNPSTADRVYFHPQQTTNNKANAPTPTDSSALVSLKSVRFVSAPKDSGLSSLVNSSESVKLYADGDWTVVVTSNKTLQISPSQVVYRELA